MGALVLCGVPPEKYWPYTDESSQFDKEPPAFVYSVADNYKTASYFRHTAPGKSSSPADVLASVKTYIAAGIPSMFGFYGFPSFNSADVKGGFPYPCEGEQANWGHALDAVGYDDKLKITNTAGNRKATGALLVRNSWGPDWGDKGYGWLPYDYVLNKLAADFWSLLSMNWIDTR
jgi:C1A family cysteine protease